MNVVEEFPVEPTAAFWKRVAQQSSREGPHHAVGEAGALRYRFEVAAALAPAELYYYFAVNVEFLVVIFYFFG